MQIPADATVTADVGIGPRDDATGFALDVELTKKLPGIDPAVARDLVSKAHIVCPHSEATRKNLDVRLKIA